MNLDNLQGGKIIWNFENQGALFIPAPGLNQEQHFTTQNFQMRSIIPFNQCH